MQEQFVSYKMALELRDKGFIEPCLGWYEVLTKEFEHDIPDWKARNGTLHLSSNIKNGNLASGVIAPLIQQVIEWLELKHDTTIWVDWDSESFLWSWNVMHRECKFSDMDNCIMGWHLKQEAVIAAIEKALKLI